MRVLLSLTETPPQSTKKGFRVSKRRSRDFDRSSPSKDLIRNEHKQRQRKKRARLKRCLRGFRDSKVSIEIAVTLIVNEDAAKQ